MTLRSVLGLRPKATDSATLRASLSETEAALAAVRAIAAELEAQRGAVLLDGSPAEAEAHEAKLSQAQAEAGRLSAMAAALPGRIEAAEAREHGIEMDKLSEHNEAAAAAGGVMVTEISAALWRVADMIEQHDAVTSTSGWRRILDRVCARRPKNVRPGRGNGLQPNKETPPKLADFCAAIWLVFPPPLTHALQLFPHF